MKSLKKTILLIVAFFWIGLSAVVAQSDTLNVSQRMDALFEQGLEGSYPTQNGNHTVIMTRNLNQLKKEVKETGKNLENELKEVKAENDRYKSQKNDSKKEIEKTREKLVNAEKRGQSVKFLGMQIEEGAFMASVIGVVLVLGFLILLFFYKYKKSNKDTVEAKENLIETEKEFDEYRQSALDKQQKLGRQLLDARRGKE